MERGFLSGFSGKERRRRSGSGGMRILWWGKW